MGHKRITGGLTVALLAIVGCGGDQTDPVTISETRRLAAHEQHLGATSAQRFGGMPAAEIAAVQQPGAPRFGYQLPDGWEAVAPTAMRPVNLRTAGGAECYLSITTGGADALRDNVDRWRRQLGLAPLDDQAWLDLERLPVLGEEAILVTAEGSFTGMGGGEAQEDWAIHGLVLARGEDVVTIKLVGPTAAVVAAHDGLLAFARSLDEAGR